MIALSKNLNVFTENFTDLFVRTGLTKHKFAELIGIDHCLIADYLNGTIPLLRNVIKICDYFNCSVDFIVGWTTDFSYTNLQKGYKKDCFFNEYQKLLKDNNTTHYFLAKNKIVTATKLSLWKQGRLPQFEVMVAIAYELGGSIDKMLGRI